jgi:hypothetical protein
MHRIRLSLSKLIFRSKNRDLFGIKYVIYLKLKKNALELFTGKFVSGL